MQQISFPADYNQVMPYLIVKDAAGFMQFMKDVFGATEKMKHMRDEHIIMHAEVFVGASVIMFAEATDAYSVSNAGMYIYVADADSTYAAALAAGASAVTPLADQSYGRSGGVQDPFGNTWWITAHNA